jgi:hypothetical protein
VPEKKPPGERWESFVERQIREAVEQGEFDGLPGMGKPIPDLHKPLDEAWWIKEKLRREQFSHTPATLGLRKEVADALEAVERSRSEAEVRAIVAAINERIVKVNRTGGSGPPTAFVPFDIEHVVDRWRARFSNGPAG